MPVLVAVPAAVRTVMCPVVTVTVGTSATIEVDVDEAICATTPLNFTSFPPTVVAKFVPLIVTEVEGPPAVGVNPETVGSAGAG